MDSTGLTKRVAVQVAKHYGAEKLELINYPSTTFSF